MSKKEEVAEHAVDVLIRIGGEVAATQDKLKEVEGELVELTMQLGELSNDVAGKE